MARIGRVRVSRPDGERFTSPPPRRLDCSVLNVRQRSFPTSSGLSGLEELGRPNPSLRSVRIAQRERVHGEAQTLIFLETGVLHALDARGKRPEALADLESALHYLTDHIAPMRHAPNREVPGRNHETIQADDAEQPGAKRVGAGGVMGVQEQKLG